MDLKDMTKHRLKELGYDGLVNTDCECGCRIDELFVCDSPYATCEAGREMECLSCQEAPYFMGLPEGESTCPECGAVLVPKPAERRGEVV